MSLQPTLSVVYPFLNVSCRCAHDAMQSNWVDKKLQVPKHSVLAAGLLLLQEQALSVTTTTVAASGTASVRPPDYLCTEVCRFEMKGKKKIKSPGGGRTNT